MHKNAEPCTKKMNLLGLCKVQYQELCDKASSRCSHHQLNKSFMGIPVFQVAK